jgi:hypothetical protein
VAVAIIVLTATAVLVEQIPVVVVVVGLKIQATVIATQAVTHMVEQVALEL